MNIFVVIITVFWVGNLFASQIVVAHFPVNDEKCIELLEGVRKNAKIKLVKITKFRKKMDLHSVIVFNKYQFEMAKRNGLRIFSIFYAPQKRIYNRLIGVLKIEGGYGKIFEELGRSFPNVDKVGIVLHNQKLIKEVANLMIYHPLVKIYRVKGKGKVFYKFKKAVDSNDMILLLPDKKVINSLTFQKIVKIILNKGVSFGGYGKFLIKYRADFAFEYDYLRSGYKIGKYLLSYKDNDFKIFEPSVRFYYR